MTAGRLISKIAAILALSAQNVSGYPSGAPSSACNSLAPQHGSPSQTASSNPYMLELGSTSADAEASVTLTLKATASDGVPFKGFIIQARYPDGTIADGEFLDFDSNYIKHLSCDGQATATVTHTNDAPKNSAQLNWKHKAITDGSESKTVEFYYTVAQEKVTFWERIRVPGQLIVNAGSAIAENEGYAEGEAEGEAEPESDLHPNYEGCFETKGCFGNPANCESSGTCVIMVSWQQSSTNDGFDFLLHGSSTSGEYLALGLSSDASMSEDLTFICVDNQVRVGWNVANDKDNELGVTGVTPSDISLDTTDGIRTCKFKLPFSLTNIKGPDGSSLPDYNLQESQYHLLLATGPMASDSKLGFHSNRVPSADPVDLANTAKVKGRSDVSIRVHGILMILAWLGSASAGMFFARYMKETWRGHKIMGKDIWFPIHTTHMMLTVLMTLIAFILIASDRGFDVFEWDFIRENPHPLLGILTIILAFINPVMAVFRPHPEASGRWIFNWAHWFVGTAAWLFGIFAIFLAGNLSAANFIPTVDYYTILLIYIIVHVLTHLVFTFQRCWALNDAASVESDSVTNIGSSGSPEAFNYEHQGRPKDEDLKGTGFRRLVSILYVLFVWAVAIILAVHIGLAKAGRESWFTDGHDHGEDEAEGEAEGEAEAEHN